MDNKVGVALTLAKVALSQVEMIEHSNWTYHVPGDYEGTVRCVEACAWCHMTGEHSDNCPRQAALAAIDKALPVSYWSEERKKVEKAILDLVMLCQEARHNRNDQVANAYDHAVRILRQHFHENRP